MIHRLAAILPSAPEPIRDVIIGTILGVAFAVATFSGAQYLPASIGEGHNTDVWFQTAVDSITGLASDRLHPKHERNNTHPFFSVSIHPPVQALHRAFGIDILTGLRLVVAGVAWCWGLCVFLLFRALRCGALDALLLTMLAMVSAGAMFFFTVPETFPFGSLSIVVALLVLAWAQRAVVPAWSYVVVNLLTFGFVITNWSAGLLVTFTSHRLPGAIRIVLRMLAIAAIVLIGQQTLYPAMKPVWDVGGELSFVHHPYSGGPMRITTAFFSHTMIAPEITLLDRPDTDRGLGLRPAILTVQASMPGSGEPWALLLVAAWSLLLAAGLWALFAGHVNPRFNVVLGVLLASQLLLHMNYGEETFLYSLHFVVLLVLLPALATLTFLRPFVVALLLLFVPAVAVNNWAQFHRAVALFHDLQRPVSAIGRGLDPSHEATGKEAPGGAQFEGLFQ